MIMRINLKECLLRYKIKNRLNETLFKLKVLQTLQRFLSKGNHHAEEKCKSKNKLEKQKILDLF